MAMSCCPSYTITNDMKGFETEYKFSLFQNQSWSLMNDSFPTRQLISCQDFSPSAGALNFRDVMLAYGKLSRDMMAHGKGGDYIGLEFSGKAGF